MSAALMEFALGVDSLLKYPAGTEIRHTFDGTNGSAVVHLWCRSGISTLDGEPYTTAGSELELDPRTLDGLLSLVGENPDVIKIFPDGAKISIKAGLGTGRKLTVESLGQNDSWARISRNVAHSLDDVMGDPDRYAHFGFATGVFTDLNLIERLGSTFLSHGNLPVLSSYVLGVTEHAYMEKFRL